MVKPTAKVSRKEERKSMRKLKKAKIFAFKSKKTLAEVLRSSGAIEKLKPIRVRKPKKKKNVKSNPKKDLEGEAKISAIRKKQERTLIREEEREGKKFAKKLGLTKRRNKSTLPQSFVEAGLDYILDVCNRKGQAKKDEALMKEKNDYGDEEKISDEEFSENSDAEMSDNEVVSDEEDADEKSGTEDSSNHPEKSRKSENFPKTDIYGREIDRKGKVVASSKTPRLGALKKLKELEESQGITTDVEKERLRKQIRGLINRLSEQTLVSSVTQLQDIYASKSRNDVKSILSESILKALSVEYQLPARLGLEYAALIALVHTNVSQELSGYFVEEMTNKLRGDVESGQTAQDDKQLTNICAMIANLLRFKVISAKFVIELLDFFADKFGEHEIELLIYFLTNVGFILRKSDPGGVKCLIGNVQRKIGERKKMENSTKEDSSRVRFMLETLMAIKNNNSLKLSGGTDESLYGHFGKMIRGLVKKGTKSENAALPFGFKDLVLAEEKGRWWIVGSAFVANSEEYRSEEIDGDAAKKRPLVGKRRDLELEFGEKLLKLAKKYRMNTELRRTIFCVLLSGEDYLDAFEKLLKLGLKDQQEREIIHICITCCLAEKTFNPYYAFVIKKFCKFHRRFQLTTQFALWDRLKEVENLKDKQVTNLARLIQELTQDGTLKLTVLKVIDFAQLDSAVSELLKKIFFPLLSENSLETVKEIFGKLAISTGNDEKLFADGLKLFFSHVLRNLSLEGKQKITLTERIDFVEQIWGI